MQEAKGALWCTASVKAPHEPRVRLRSTLSRTKLAFVPLYVERRC